MKVRYIYYLNLMDFLSLIFSQKYLLEIANRINTLTYKKGTKDGLQLISKMFEEISIYKYYIVKRLKNQGVLNYDGMSNKDKYELFFVKAPLSADDPYEYMQKEEKCNTLYGCSI